MDPTISKKLDLFFKPYKLLNYKKGELLLRPDDPIHAIFLLKKGYVRQYVISEDGEEITINIFRPTSFIPIMLVLSEVDNKYYFEATEPVEVLKAPTEKTLEFLKNNPDVLFDLTKRFAKAINGLAKRIEDLTSDAYQRVISLLLYLITRFGEKDEDRIVINLPLTHKDIAAWVNLTRETTSRQLEKLEHDGLISQKDRLITVIDPAKLQQLL